MNMRYSDIVSALIGLLLAVAIPANAQWLDVRDKGIPRLPDGKPNLAAPAPRTREGKPDLTGVWKVEGAERGEARRVIRDPNQVDPGLDLDTASKYFMNIFADFKPGEEPMRPEAAAILKERLQSMGALSPTFHCLPGGIPFSTILALFKMVQAPAEIIVLPEDNNPPRQIYLDGRSLPKDPDPSWMGYSAGRWEGDTLVVETVGFNDKTWLDALGHPRSESMRLTERYRRKDFGHMEIELTIDDSKMYTRPFTVKLPVRLMADSDVLESICAENEKDRAHVGK